MSMHYTRIAFAGALLGAVFGSGQAFAADAKQIADSLVAAVTASGKSTASYENATASGDDVTITGVKVAKADGSDAVTIPSVVIIGAQPRDKGGFTAASMSFDNGTMTTDDSTVTWKAASLTSPTVPSADEIKADSHKISPFSKLDMAELNISGGELAAPIDIGSVGVGIEVDQAGTPKDFVLDVMKISIPAAVYADEAQVKAVVDALGYNGFILNVGVAGGYDTATDTLTLRGFTVDTVDAGKFAISGTFSGVPLSKLADEDKQSEIGATGKLDSLVIRFDNAGIVERALDMQAKMMGGSRDDVVNQIGGALPFMLMSVGNQPFQDALAAAGQAFLKDPKSITISAQPAEPVPFSTIMDTAGKAPQTLPDVLKVEVIANN